jgi:uridine phosphorylase
MTKVIPESELILTPDGKIYHLGLRPEDLAETIITVGDPDRVSAVSKYFDHIELKMQHREFITHTGNIGKKRITVLSTGMGTDNMDIVMNELDALVNIDLKSRTVKDKLTSLNIIRVGTAGGLQDYLDVDSFVVSDGAFGMDGLLNHYSLFEDESFETEEEALKAWDENIDIAFEFDNHVMPINETYFVEGDEILTGLFGNKKDFHHGFTVTCSGFYGPQGRSLRLKPEIDDFIEKLSSFNYKDKKILNFEMETSGLYGLGKLMGHYCCSVSVIVANRVKQKFSKDGAAAVDSLIKNVLETIGK